MRMDDGPGRVRACSEDLQHNPSFSFQKVCLSFNSRDPVIAQIVLKELGLFRPFDVDPPASTVSKLLCLNIGIFEGKMEKIQIFSQTANQG